MNKLLHLASATINPSEVGIPANPADTVLTDLLNVVYFAAGIAAVIVIIVSAFFYVASQGDAGKIKRAKDGILYSVVGLVIVMIAFVITNFIIGRFSQI